MDVENPEDNNETQFVDITDNKAIQAKLTNFVQSVDNIERLINKTLPPEKYEKLSVSDKVSYDLGMVYAFNTLYWMYLRTNGINPNKNEVKDQLARIQHYMTLSKQAHDRNTIRPTLNQAVAARFIKHGIQHSADSNEEPPAKKMK